MDGVAAQLALELVGRTLGDHLAAIDDRQPGRQLVGLLEVVGGQQHGLAVIARQARDLAATCPRGPRDRARSSARRGTAPAGRGRAPWRCRDVAASRPSSRGPPGRRPRPSPNRASSSLDALLECAARACRRCDPAGAGSRVPSPGRRRPSPARRRRSAAAPDRARRRRRSPATVAPPSSGCASVVRILTAVDFPAPLGPSRPKIVPGATRSDSSSSARHALRIGLHEAVRLDCRLHSRAPFRVAISLDRWIS